MVILTTLSHKKELFNRQDLWLIVVNTVVNYVFEPIKSLANTVLSRVFNTDVLHCNKINLANFKKPLVFCVYIYYNIISVRAKNKSEVIYSES